MTAGQPERTPVPGRSGPDRPVVGVGAVIFRPGEVLLIRRGTPPLRGTWSLPGGRQDLGETVIEAVHREVAEETGVSIRLLGLIDVVDLIGRNERGGVDWHYTIIELAATWEAGEPRPSSDAADVAWVDIDRTPALGLTAETERIIAAARCRWPQASAS